MLSEIIKKIACMICREELRPPVSDKSIKIDELRRLLRGQFPDAQIFLSDMDYKLCSIDDVNYFLKQDKTDKIKYQREYWDCDDASYRLLGQFSIPGWSALCFGICWSDLHSLNCFLDEAKQFWFVEPQKDTIQKNLSEWQGSKIRLIII